MPFKLTPTARRRIYEAYGGMCAYCGLFVEWRDYDVDHRIPRALGGGHEDGNLRVSHKTCNRRAGSRMVRPGASGLPRGVEWASRDIGTKCVIACLYSMVIALSQGIWGPFFNG